MEVKLWNDKREREMYENFAELFVIIKATEKLEKLYVRDIISPAEYEPECQKLIGAVEKLLERISSVQLLDGSVVELEQISKNVILEALAP